MNTQELFSLKGKTILITGGSGLYGQCIVQALLDCGGTVITASTDLDKAQKLVNSLKSKEFDVYAKRVDQSCHQSVIKLKDELAKEFGGIDIFINNAVARPMKRYSDPLECWAKSMQVNATGMFDMLREMADLIECHWAPQIQPPWAPSNAAS